MTTGVIDKNGFSSNIAKFAINFCNELDRSKSVVSSPLSAELMLALFTLAAEEPAHSELLTALDIPNNDAIRSSFSTLSAELKALKGVTLNVANRVYVKEGPYALDPRLQEDAVNVFDAGIEKIDFSKSDAAAQQINQWVENKTNKKFTDLISPESLDAETRMVLVNALYFVGNWDFKFDPSNTVKRRFYITATKKKRVPMMYQHAYFNYRKSEELNAEFLLMFYEEKESSMVIILPKTVEGLDGMMQKLASGYDLMADLEKMRLTNIFVFLPKFRTETELDLNELLPKLGIKSIFNKTSSGIKNFLNPPESLYVSQAVQKVFIDVNEVGTEAAAATYAQEMPCSVPPRFVADRPFLYLLLGPASHVLFIGIYNGT